MPDHRFHLPREDGTWLVDPALREWPGLLEANHAALSLAEIDCQGRTLHELRQATQQSVGVAAARYTSELLGIDVPVPAARRWIVTGHQPELFHVGVWVKNIAVHHFARQTSSVGLNLIVDQDTHTGTSILVPAGTQAAPRLEPLPFHDPLPVCPWEELTLTDRNRFDTFPQRVTTAMAAWQIVPVVNHAWPAALRWADQVSHPRLADCLAAARASQEHQWGAGNLELPMSQVAGLPEFLWFAAQILGDAPSFLALHNDIVQTYRRRHGLRSRTHPVPDLAIQDGWTEVPFWVWRTGDTQRDRLFVRRVGTGLLLRDRRDVFLRLPLPSDGSAERAVEHLQTLPSLGIRLRSRALTTTLFARLFLADLFVHGIGGAKYDEMTDELMARFYRLPAPEYATISATLHLPAGGMHPVSAEDQRKISRALWQLQHQPERFVSADDDAAAGLCREKRQLIGEQRDAESRVVRARTVLERDQNRMRYNRLREINRLLQPAVAAERLRWEARQHELSESKAANRVLGSREFAWLLFPAERLQAFLSGMPLHTTSAAAHVVECQE